MYPYQCYAYKDSDRDTDTNITIFISGGIIYFGLSDSVG